MDKLELLKAKAAEKDCVLTITEMNELLSDAMTYPAPEYRFRGKSLHWAAYFGALTGEAKAARDELRANRA